MIRKNSESSQEHNWQQGSTGNSPLFSRPASHSVQRKYIHDNKFHLNVSGHCCTNTKFLKCLRLCETKANKICLYLQSVYAVHMTELLGWCLESERAKCWSQFYEVSAVGTFWIPSPSLLYLWCGYNNISLAKQLWIWEDIALKEAPFSSGTGFWMVKLFHPWRLLLHALSILWGQDCFH